MLFLPMLGSISTALRIPALAVFIGQLAATVLGWFAVRMTRGLALNLVVVTMVIGLAVAIATSMMVVISGLSYLTPSYINQAFSYFVPSNAIPCVSAIFSARVIRWVWQWQFYVITKISS